MLPMVFYLSIASTVYYAIHSSHVNSCDYLYSFSRQLATNVFCHCLCWDTPTYRQTLLAVYDGHIWKISGFVVLLDGRFTMRTVGGFLARHSEIQYVQKCFFSVIRDSDWKIVNHLSELWNQLYLIFRKITAPPLPPKWLDRNYKHFSTYLSIETCGISIF
jgi:hypothetical protein